MNINYILISCLISFLISLVYGLDNIGFNRLDYYHQLGECADFKCSKENAALINIIRIIEKNDYKFNHKLKSCKNCMIKFYEKLNEEEKCKFRIGRESMNLKYDKLSFEQKREFMSRKFKLLKNDEKLELKNCLIENKCQMEIEFYEKYKDRNEFRQLIECLNRNCSKEFRITNSTDRIDPITNTTEPTTASTKLNKKITNTTEPTTKSTNPIDLITASTKLNKKITNTIDPTKSTNSIEPTTASTKMNEKITNTTNPTTKSTNPIEPTTASTKMNEKITKSTNPTDKITASTKLSQTITKSSLIQSPIFPIRTTTVISNSCTINQLNKSIEK